MLEASCERQKSHASIGYWPFEFFVFSGCSRLEHRHNTRMLEVARRDAFEVRANTTQFGRDETIDKM